MVSEPATRCLWFHRRDNRPRLITRFSDDEGAVMDDDVVVLLLLTDTGVNKLSQSQQTLDYWHIGNMTVGYSVVALWRLVVT